VSKPVLSSRAGEMTFYRSKSPFPKEVTLTYAHTHPHTTC
jgi:hypothetical protein